MKKDYWPGYVFVNALIASFASAGLSSTSSISMFFWFIVVVLVVFFVSESKVKSSGSFTCLLQPILCSVILHAFGERAGPTPVPSKSFALWQGWK